MISICFPTRGRPESFKIMCMSALGTAYNPDDVEFVTYHDNDDKSEYQYIGHHKEIVGERIVHSQMHNECMKAATGPIYMFAADDVIFYTRGWDKIVKDIFDKSVDKILFVYPNDENFGESLGVTGFLHKNWIDAVGYLFPSYFAAWHADNWVNDLAAKINRKVFLKNIIIKHISIEHDNTHKEYMQKEVDANAIYNSKEAEREKDAKLLQDFINKYLPKFCMEMEISLLDLFFPNQASQKDQEFMQVRGIYELPVKELIKDAVYLGNGKVRLSLRCKHLQDSGKCEIDEEKPKICNDFEFSEGED